MFDKITLYYRFFGVGGGGGKGGEGGGRGGRGEGGGHAFTPNDFFLSMILYEVFLPWSRWIT